MAAYISKKKALIRLSLSLCAAAGAMALCFWLLQGPRLFPHYDFLLGRVEGAAASGELLLIETRLPQPAGDGAEASPERLPSEDFVEPASVASVLMALTEMNAGTLIIQVPVSESPLAGAALSGAPRDDLRLRFDSEYALVERNIRNLFEAIRLGFILPVETERYVGELVNITLRGKDRLLRALGPSGRPEQSPLDRAMAVFGNAWAPGKDLYGDALPDPDGRIRRVAPIMAEGGAIREHVAYAALKSRLEPAEPDMEGPSPLLFVPVSEGDFRRIPLAAFLEYEDADRELYRLLSNAESQGIYAELNPEAYPGYLYEYARDLREELLREPGGERKALWLNARAGYYQSLEDFFGGPSEALLVEGYEDLIDSESLEVEGIRRITALRNELILSFRNLREKYAALLEIRAALALASANSLCILGPPGADLENSAILANTLLTQRVVSPARDRDTLLWSAVGVAPILAALCTLGPWVSLGLGLSLAAILGTAFSYGFILTAVWMDPLVPLASALAGVLVSFAFALLSKRRAASRLRAAYGSRMAPAYLRGLIRVGQPFSAGQVGANAAIIAVRDGSLNGLESQGKPQDAASAATAFREEAFRLFGTAGAALVGLDGDLAVFALGSPLERRAMTKMKALRPYDDSDSAPSPQSPEARAATLVLDLLKSPKAESWHFAIDAGECGFSWSPAAGYAASGRAVLTARLLSNLCPRYKARALASRRVAEKLGEGAAREAGAKKLGSLVDQGSGEREEVYGLG